MNLAFLESIRYCVAKYPMLLFSQWPCVAQPCAELGSLRLLVTDAANGGCEQSILARFGGVMGILIVVLGCWVVMGLWPALVQGMQLLRASHRSGRRPEYSATDSVQQRGLSSVDVGREARRLLVRTAHSGSSIM
jgi:hypothetical protein